jgi:hypothetical protein
VTGSFECQASVYARGGKLFFHIAPRAPVEGAPGFSPGTFELPERPTARTYTLDDLGMGRAAVAAEGGTLYNATKTSSQRGEVRLTLRRLRKDARAEGLYLVRGSYRARLVPAGGGKTGEVVVEVDF